MKKQITNMGASEYKTLENLVVDNVKFGYRYAVKQVLSDDSYDVTAIESLIMSIGRPADFSFIDFMVLFNEEFDMRVREKLPVPIVVKKASSFIKHAF